MHIWFGTNCGSVRVTSTNYSAVTGHWLCKCSAATGLLCLCQQFRNFLWPTFFKDAEITVYLDVATVTGLHLEVSFAIPYICLLQPQHLLLVHSSSNICSGFYSSPNICYCSYSGYNICSCILILVPILPLLPLLLPLLVCMLLLILILVSLPLIKILDLLILPSFCCSCSSSCAPWDFSWSPWCAPAHNLGLNFDWNEYFQSMQYMQTAVATISVCGLKHNIPCKIFVDLPKFKAQSCQSQESYSIQFW